MLENGRQRLKRLKKSSRRTGGSDPRPQKANFFPAALCAVGSSVGAREQTESETQQVWGAEKIHSPCDILLRLRQWEPELCT